ncbi:MAG: hypothetical protein D6B28_11115 [Gammaproteobacteria bacterium]|nr:MAG: hypothetical protein D6B28_11115 [Gammaproteobacteria bacterium]
MDFDICKGMIFQGNHMQSGHYIAYYSWDEHPFEVEQIKELWVFAPDGKRICYFDPTEHKEWFPVYHDFDAVIGARISQSWQDENSLYISAECDDGANIVINIDVATWHKWEGDPFEGKTETDKRYRNIPDQLGICGPVNICINGDDLGDTVKPNEPIFLGSAPVPDQSIINRCIMELEPQ